jgi:rod shape-determining protein MreC
MGEIFRNKFFIIMLIIICVLTLSTIILNLSGYGSVVSDITSLILSPFQGFSQIMRTSFSGFTGYFTEFSRMKERIAELEEQLAAYQSEAGEARRAIDENIMLRSFFELKRQRMDFDLEPARITAGSPGNFSSEFTVNRGSLHGIGRDMPVVAAGSGADYIVVGYIREVGLTSSKVVCFIRAGEAIGAYIERTKETGIIEGVFELEQDGRCRFRPLPGDSALEFQVGDRIYSSGEGSRYPEGLYIGEIIRLVADPFTHTMTGIIEPAMDFSGGTVRDVMIIRSFERKFE